MDKAYNKNPANLKIDDQISPTEGLEEICKRNEIRYGDQFGPTIEWYRAKGFDWEQIIEKSLRTGSRRIKFNKNPKIKKL